MKLFLASSLCFVGDIISSEVDLEGKKVGCIWNAADQRGGKSAFWNKWDREFFESQDAVLIDIDVSIEGFDLARILGDIDVLFVGGGDTRHIANLLRPYSDAINTYIKNGLIYMGTSAGAMVACTDIYYPVEGKDNRGLGCVDISLIPHRGSPSFREDRDNNIMNMYNHGTSYMMLTDIDVLIVDEQTQRIERSKVWNLEEVYAKIDKFS